MTRTKVFLPKVPTRQDDVLKWAEQITHVLDELNLRAEKGTKESVSTRTGYIDLPIENMFSNYNAGAGVVLERLVPGPVVTTEPRLYQLGSANNSYRALAWIAAAYSTGALNTNRFHCNFRLPDYYVANTDLTVHLSSTYTVVDNATAADVATIDMEAYRNIPATDKQGFGYRVDPAVDTWTETDLSLTAIQNVLRHTSGSSEFDKNTFTVDGDQTTYPLTIGNLIQLEFTAAINDGGSNAAMYLADFYVSYVARG